MFLHTKEYFHGLEERTSASKFRAAFCALVFAASLLPSAAPARVPAENAGPHDLYGRPVESGKGKLNYRRDQTEGLAEVHRPAAPAAQKGAAPPGQLAPNDFQLAWH